jgi:hypothetical protein
MATKTHKRSHSKKSSKTAKKTNKTKLGANEAYCLQCRNRVTMVDAKTVQMKRKGGKMGSMKKGICSKNSSHKVFKIVS